MQFNFNPGMFKVPTISSPSLADFKKSLRKTKNKNCFSRLYMQNFCSRIHCIHVAEIYSAFMSVQGFLCGSLPDTGADYDLSPIFLALSVMFFFH